MTLLPLPRGAHFLVPFTHSAAIPPQMMSVDPCKQSVRGNLFQHHSRVKSIGDSGECR